MPLPQADDVQRIAAAASDLARGAGRELSTVHHLFAMLVTPCDARELLAEVGADHRAVLASYRRLASREENARVLAQVWQSADSLAQSSGTGALDSTVLLAGLLRVRRALAARALREAGIDVTHLRARVIGQLTLGLDRGRRARRGGAAVATPASEPTPRALPLPTGLIRAVRARDDARRRRDTVPERREAVRGRAAADGVTRVDGPGSRGSVGRSPVEAPGAILSHTARAPEGKVASSPAAAATSTPITQPSLRSAAAPVFARGVFQVDPGRFPLLAELGRNLTEAALDGEVHPLIGRDEIVDAAIDVLMMRQVNNPCLVGEAGVGKTAIVEGLARRLAGEQRRYGRLGQAAIIELSVSSLLAGTSFRGAFSQRMKALRDEVAAAEGNVIVFIDEIHTLMGAGAGEGPLDAANDLKTALARGRFPLIGATTRDEYRRHIEKDPAMERRFQVIEVTEPSAEEAIAILAGVAPIYARHHELPFAHDALVSAVHLSRRFITDRCLPDKAIAVIDRAGSHARRRGKERVEADDVARAVHQLTRVPLERLLADERSRIRDLDADLKARIVGHDDALDRVARRVRRNYAGFAGDRPLASLLFIGAPGTGKTAAAAALAESLFLVDDALVRFDMTEYADAHSVSRLLGSPPGYVGYREPGLLSQAMHKRPYRVLLFDDVDRAAPEVVALLMQVMDTGRIRDSQGQQLDLRNTIVVLTTTVEAAVMRPDAASAIGFAAPSQQVAEGPDEEALRRHVGAELWGRVDEQVLFAPLPREALVTIAEQVIQRSLARLYEARLVRVTADPSVVGLVVGPDIDTALGARPLRARVEALVESFLAEQVLAGRLQPGHEQVLCARGDALHLVAPVPALPAHVPEGTMALPVVDALGAELSDVPGAEAHAQAAAEAGVEAVEVAAQATAPTQTSPRERP